METDADGGCGCCALAIHAGADRNGLFGRETIHIIQSAKGKGVALAHSWLTKLTHYFV
jgi:hypothetical protein